MRVSLLLNSFAKGIMPKRYTNRDIEMTISSKNLLGRFARSSLLVMQKLIEMPMGSSFTVHIVNMYLT